MASFVRTPESRFKNLPLFPYEPHYVHLPSSKEFRLAYIDESTPNYSPQKSKIFLCLHGVPTYSYLYRKMIPVLLSSNNYHNKGVRVICPDFIGWGRSDKPINPNIHQFKYHRNTIIELLQYLKLDNFETNITLICQDWGGLIGLTLPIAFISYKVDNKSLIINKINNNPIKRIMFFNTILPTGQLVGRYFLRWRNMSRNVEDLDILRLMNMMNMNHLSKQEITGYNAPFVNKDYKLAIRCWPSNVPIHPNYPGLDIWHKANMFYQTNKLLDDTNKEKIKLFQAHGCLDEQFKINGVKNIYKQMIDKQGDDGLDVEYGISSEIGGVLWVANSGHFLQESVDTEWVIKKALKYFGDIPYDDVEYEWMVSPKTKKINIIKITLNKIALTFNMIKGLNYILSKFSNSTFCDGFILTSNNVKGRKTQIFGAGYDFSLFAKKDRNLTKQYFFALKKLDYLLNISKKPIIAAINGACIAGSTLMALQCDYRLMFNDTFISMNEVRNGIKFGSPQIIDLIKRYVGSKEKAIYVLQTGRNFYGEDAKQIGLINQNIKQRNIKILLNEAIRVLEDDYFPADKDAAYIPKQFGRMGTFKHYKDYTEQDGDAYVDVFFDKKVQDAIQKLFNRKKKKSKL